MNRHGELLLHFVTASFSILAAFSVVALLMQFVGLPPLPSLGLIFWGGIGSSHNFIESLVAATPLLLVSQGLAISFTAKVWNIGAEGQIYVGGLTAAWTALLLKDMPPILTLSVALILGALAGMAWAFLPAFLKAYENINEIFTTLFMNYIAIYIVSYLLLGPLRDPISFYPQTEILPKQLHLPVLIEGTRLHLGIFFAIFVVTPLVYIFLKRTSFGLRLKIYGSSEKSAIYAGIKRKRVIMTALLTSGFLAGLAGAVEVLAIQFTMRLTLSPGWGYTGIAVAILGYLHPLGVLAASIFFGIVYTGTFTLSAIKTTPIGIASVVQGLVLIFIMAGSLLERKVVKRWLSLE